MYPQLESERDGERSRSVYPHRGMAVQTFAHVEALFILLFNRGKYYEQVSESNPA